MWIGLTTILPYIFLGFAAFRSLTREKYIWLAAIFMDLPFFLGQGPIHPPLIFKRNFGCPCLEE